MKDALEIVNQTLSAFWVESSFGFVCIRARRPGPRSGTTVYWPLCPFAHLTVAYWSDKKTRISTGLLLPSGNCARENGARPNVLYAGKTLHSCFVWGCRHLVLCSNQDRWTFSSLWSVSRYRHRVQCWHVALYYWNVFLQLWLTHLGCQLFVNNSISWIVEDVTHSTVIHGFTRRNFSLFGRSGWQKLAF